jgi:hypothetical protein
MLDFDVPITVPYFQDKELHFKIGTNAGIPKALPYQ